MASFLDRLIQSISSGVIKRHVADYIMPEQPFDTNVIDLRDGTQMTIIKVIGMQVIYGEQEFVAGVEQLDKYFKTTIGGPGFYNAVFFERDPDFTERGVDAVLKPMGATARQLGMDISDILADRKKVLMDNTVYESCHMAVFTTGAALQEGAKAAFERRAKAGEQFAKIPRGDFSPNYYGHLDELDTVHENHVQSLVKALEYANVSYDILDAEQASSVLGFQLERDVRSPNWRAKVGKLPGRKDSRKHYPMMPSQRDLSDPSYLIQMPISEALTQNDHVTTDLNGTPLPDGYHRQGRMYYCTLAVKFWPDNITSFQDLFRMVGKDIPYRMAYYIDKNEEMTFTINKMARSVVGSWGNRRNGIAKEQTELMRDNVARNMPHFRFRGQVTTWGKSVIDLNAKVHAVQTSLSKWGSCEAIIYSPNPMEAFASSCVGATYDTPAPSHYAPGADIAQLLPFTRPASLWDFGSAQFITPDAKLWTYKVAAEEMENNNLIAVAKPRSGKSVTLNALDFSLVFQEGMSRLPRILTVDSAPSSKGKIELLHDRLPPHMKNQVRYFRPSNKKNSEKINVLSLPLGLKEPLPEHAEFLEAFITQLSLSVAATEVPENIPEIVREAILLTYGRLSETDNRTGDRARLYVPGVFPEIDELLPAITPADLMADLQVRNGKTQIHWYEVRDILFKANNISLAKQAQMAASPTLPDVVNTLNQSELLIIKWGKETLRKIASAIQSSMESMPMIDGMSNVDFDSVRILSFDCGEFAQAMTQRGARQSTLIYMVALFAGTQQYFYDTGILANFDPLYKQYAELLVAECMEDYKRVNVDEYWRTKGLPGVAAFVQTLFRVGPKFNISNLVATQDLNDCSEALIKSASGFMFLGKPKQSELASIEEHIGLTESALNLLKSNSFGGVPGEMLFIFDTNRGRFYQHLFLKLGRTELWANSSTNRDTTLRRDLITEFGQGLAYKILAHDFPSGNCAHQVNAIKKARGQDIIEDDDDVESPDSAVKELASRIINKYRKMQEDTGVLPFH